MESRARFLIDLTTTLAILVTCALLVSANWNRLRPRDPVSPALPTEPVPLGEGARLGSPEASVAIIAFSDYQCPFCRHFETQVLPALDKTYVQPGDVLLVVKHFPLEAIHPLAFPAAVAAECARRQGQFWPFHRKLFERQKELDGGVVETVARDLSLARTEFDACRHDETAAALVKHDAESALRLGLTGTPGFVVGMLRADGQLDVTDVLRGYKPFRAFADVIEPLIAQGEGAS